MPMKSLAPWLPLAVLVWPSSALAQDAATAEVLFRDAKALMAEGKFAEACPKFAASQELDAGLGTLLNLADCHEKVGQTATAWAEFLEAAYQARSKNATAHEQVARERARLLEAKLVRLTIAMEQPPPGIRVTRSGESVPAETFGVAAPVDPGEIEVTATAEGYLPWTTKVLADADHNNLIVSIPALTPAPVAPVAVAPAVVAAPPAAAEPVPAPAAATAQTQTASDSTWTGWHTTGVVAAGAGVLGMGMGLALTLTASSEWNNANCPNNVCETAEDQSRAQSAKSQADIATVAWIAGGTLTAAGVSLILFAPDSSTGPEDRAALRVVPVASDRGAGLWLNGQF